MKSVSAWTQGKRLRVIGSTLRNRSLKYKSALICELEREIWPSFATGELVVEVDAVYPIKRVQEAHNHMRADANFGKILLTVGARHGVCAVENFVGLA